MDTTTVFYWAEVPVDGRYGACSDWVGAGERGEWGETLVSDLNIQLGTNFANCEAFVGNTTETCSATAVALSENGTAVVECLTPEAANDDTVLSSASASEFWVPASLVAGSLLLSLVSV